MFGFLMPCWYSYSYRNDQYIFGQGDTTCLRSSKRSLIPSKTKYPLGKHPNNLISCKIIPRYGLRARHRAREHPQHPTQPNHNLNPKNIISLFSNVANRDALFMNDPIIVRIRFRASDFGLVAKINVIRAKLKQASCAEMVVGSFVFSLV